MLVSLPVLQVLNIIMSRYGENCVLSRHGLDLAQNQEVVVEVEREAEAESAIIQTCK